MRTLGASEFGRSFGMEGAEFPPDRFTEYADYASALAAYENEATVQLFFESGAGDVSQPGAPVPRFEAGLSQWPSAESMSTRWFLGPENTLSSAPPEVSGAHAWTFDLEAGTDTFFGPDGYQILVPLWDIDWRRFTPENMVSYRTEPFTEAKVITGPGIAELWVKSPVDDVTVQVTLTEVRPDGYETLIQSGWLRLGHRASEADSLLRVQRSFSAEAFREMPIDQWERAQVALPSFAHPMRAGSALRMVISAPGRDHGTWEFEAPNYESAPSIQIGYGPNVSSMLSLGTLPEIEIPDTYPPCPSLRGQPCRQFEVSENTSVPSVNEGDMNSP